MAANVFAIPPVVSKVFINNVIDAPGGSSLVIELINPNFAPAVLSSPFTDLLPAGLTTTGAPLTTCAGTAVNTPTSVTLNAGAIIPGSGSCTITQGVTAALQDNYLNVIPANALQTSQGNSQEDTVVTLTVNGVLTDVTVAKAFSDASVAPGQQSTLIITLSNNSAIVATEVEFTETFPAGLFSLNNGTTTCGGTLGGGTTGVTLTGGTIAAGGACTISVPVFAQTAGNYINTIPEGALTANFITAPVANADPASATLVVVPPELRPVVAKAFVPSQVQCGNSILIITLSNPSTTAAVLTAPFVDRLPSGLIVRSNPTNTCGGTVSVQQNSIVTLNNGTIPALGSCQIQLLVSSNCDGVFLNRIFPGALQTNIGSNLNTASASVNFCCNALAETRDVCLSESTVDDGSEMSLYDGQ